MQVGINLGDHMCRAEDVRTAEKSHISVCVLTYKRAEDVRTAEKSHISVCVLTYKRPQLLERLLKELEGQETGGQFTYSIVVADNDRLRSSEALVSAVAATSSIRVTYCVEPQQNISLARNRAIENATGDFIAFIDDDEFPTNSWLLTLFEACQKYQSDGV